VLVALKSSCFNLLLQRFGELELVEASSDNIPSKEALYWQRSFPIRLVLQVSPVMIGQSHMFLLSGSFLVPTLMMAILSPLGCVARQQLYFLPLFHAFAVFAISDYLFQTTVVSLTARLSGWKRVVSPLTKTPLLKRTLMLKSHLTLMLKQRKKRPKVSGMSPKMLVIAKNLMTNQKRRRRNLQVEWEHQLSPPPHGLAHLRQRLYLKGFAHHPRPPPVVKSGKDEVFCKH
jgi:hypothetical protein